MLSCLYKLHGLRVVNYWRSYVAGRDQVLYSNYCDKAFCFYLTVVVACCVTFVPNNYNLWLVPALVVKVLQ